MGACGVKKCHGITEQDPLAMQVPVPYMNTTIIIKKIRTDSHMSQIAEQTSSTHTFTHSEINLDMSKVPIWNTQSLHTRPLHKKHIPIFEETQKYETDKKQRKKSLELKNTKFSGIKVILSVSYFLSEARRSSFGYPPADTELSNVDLFSPSKNWVSPSLEKECPVHKIMYNIIL